MVNHDIMIKKILSILFVLLISVPLSAQGNKAERYADHSLLASGKWVKIRVSDSGVYEISKSKLSSMGFSNPANVSLYGYNLPILPETFIENIYDDLVEIPLYRKNDGSVLFYSCGPTLWQRKKNTSDFTHINNPYSSYIYYFLTENSNGPKEMPTESNNANQNFITSFPDHALIESDAAYFVQTGRTFFEGYDYNSGNKKTYKLQLPGIAKTDTKLLVQFAAAGTSTSRLSVTADDTTYSYISFRSLVEYEYGVLQSKTYNFKKKDLSETASITLTHNRNSGVSGRLDFLQVNYDRKLDLSGQKFLAFRPSITMWQTFKVAGANENTHILRVTSPERTCEMTGKLDGGTYVCSTGTMSQMDEYVALNVNASFPEPEVIGAIENQDLHAVKDIDFVIIVPANGKLTAQAQRLADAHTAKDSLRCIVVRADQIYNEFSSGTPDATAYRRFLKMLYDKAETAADRPKNVCLFGDGYWDNRMVTAGLAKKNPNDYLLCYESVGSLSHTDSYVMEEYITLLADGKGISPLKEKPDCGVGRISATTTSEARGVVDKLIRYINNEETGSWKNTVCFLADDGNSNIHMKDADDDVTIIESLYPDYRIRKIYWDSYTREQTGAGMSYTGAYNDINKQMEDGALIMNYTGHGAAYCLSHEQVIKRADFANWSSPRLPLWIHAACDISPFDMNEENIGETALLNDAGAAMGVITTTRTVYSAQNKKLNMFLMKYLLGTDPKDGHRYTVGEALANAKSDIINTSSSLAKRDSINKCHFVLLGDPAIALTTPKYKVVVDKFNERNVPLAEIDTIGAGAIVSVAGHIVDEDGNLASNYNGLISPTVLDNIELVKCNNNEGEDIDPYEFYSRIRTIYNGSDSIKNGKFAFTFPVPLDINYSNKTGLLNLYATNNSNTLEANGSFTDFALGGTDPNLSDDKNGPEITITLNGHMFTNKSDSIQICDVIMHETPFFNGYLLDENGINTIGSGIGHDITLVIDNDPNLTFYLNNDFKYVPGSWSEGSVSYSLPELAAGSHTLLFRAWDMLNNPSSLQLEFVVEEGTKPTIFDMKINGPIKDQLTLTIENDRPQSTLTVDVQVFDVTGREVFRRSETNASASNVYTYTCNLNSNGGHLPPGIYIARASVCTGNGAKSVESKKFLVVAQ